MNVTLEPIPRQLRQQASADLNVEVSTVALSEKDAERAERDAGMIIALLRHDAPAEQIGVARKMDVGRALAADVAAKEGCRVGLFKLSRVFEPKVSDDRDA